MTAMAQEDISALLARIQTLEDQLRAQRKFLVESANRFYCEACDIARKSETLGWEAKLKFGSFGKAEMDAHAKMNHLFGGHFLIMETLAEMDRSLELPDNEIPIHQ